MDETLLTLGTCMRVKVVVLCMNMLCLFVCYHDSYMYLIESWVSLGLLNVCIVWISLILLCSKVLATFADHICLLHLLTIS